MNDITVNHDFPDSVNLRFKDLMEEEALELKKEILETARLGIEAYGEGERRLGLIVINQSLRIADGYMELSERLGHGSAEAYEIIAGLNVIKQLMNENSDVKYVWSVFNEL